MYVYMNDSEGQQLLWFAPNYGVTVKPAILNQSPERIRDLIETALEYNDNRHLIDACQGGRGPLSDYGYMIPISFEDLKSLLEAIRIKEETKRAKQRITKQRRSEFQGKRARIVLEMIDGGILYVCAWRDCTKTDDLTLDHILPVSRGGTDEVSNLQFLCKSHNSKKGDRAVEIAA